MVDVLMAEANLRTGQEQEAASAYARTFSHCSDSVEIKLANFPKYVRRQNLTRLLSLYELFKKVLNMKGSIIECGVYRGFSLMAWANFSAILEPSNLTRRIYGFDTFSGFASLSEKDRNRFRAINESELNADSYDELLELVKIYDSNRFLGHIDKVQLIKGDASITIPEFVATNPHLVVSLLFLDFDLYEPTRVAIEQLMPRMPKGSIIAFDELDNPIWPGEAQALVDAVGISQLELRRLDWDPYVAYAVLR